MVWKHPNELFGQLNIFSLTENIMQVKKKIQFEITTMLTEIINIKAFSTEGANLGFLKSRDFFPFKVIDIEMATYNTLAYSCYEMRYVCIAY